MLEVAHLVRRFGDNTAVDDVSFAVAPGTMTGFVGANGAGKTTTMRMIMGVLAAHGGEITWNGRPVSADDRRSFGYMPEERGLYPKQPVRDQLVYLARLRGLSASEAKHQAADLLERFSLLDRGADKLESLSLGNQQRVQIAAALIAHPTALILDEPFSGLDPVAVDSMADLLGQYAARGVPVLFSSHQLDLVERLCDHLVILAKGRVVADGSAEQLRGGPPPPPHPPGGGRPPPGRKINRRAGGGKGHTKTPPPRGTRRPIARDHAVDNIRVPPPLFPVRGRTGLPVTVARPRAAHH
ncbi:ABC transporter ATP-binding protein, partial [Nocardia cyriacigeorgica]|uniref:ABC transporter ATP-binding protein n=1 Tax=Nocardia cyriacigeorgica TaxID=135487 RepID=UPI0024585D3F